MLKPYLFMIRSRETSRPRGKRIIADSYKSALSTICSQFPGKLITTKYAKTMDLITAKVEAAKMSRVENRPIYINVKPDGECFLHHKADETTHAAYKNGSEIAIPVESMDNPQKPEPIVRAGKSKQLEKVEGFTPKPLPAKNIKPAKVDPNAKQSSKVKVEGAEESSVKKSSSTNIQNNKSMNTVKTATKTAKKVSTPAPAKKAAAPAKKAESPATKGTTTMTAKQLRDAVIAGHFVYNTAGTSIPCTNMAAKDPSRKYSVLVKQVGKDKAYHITK